MSDAGTYGPILTNAGFTVISLGMKKTSLRPGPLARAVRKVREIRPDLIQGWMYHGNLVASILGIAVGERIPVLWNVRHSLYEPRNERVRTRLVLHVSRFLVSRVARVLYNCERSRVQHEMFGFDGSESLVIPNGFDSAHWRPDGVARAEFRREHCISEQALVVGHVARVHPIKDHQTFLRAAARVGSAMPNVHFVIVGRGAGTLRDRIPTALGASPNGRVHLLEERSDIERVLPAFDVFCLSSRAEAFPNALAEAMACGVPCVATDVGECREILGTTGAAVPAGDERAMAAAIFQLLQKDPSLRRTLGLRARERIVSRFELNDTLDAYTRVYDDTAATPREF